MEEIIKTKLKNILSILIENTNVTECVNYTKLNKEGYGHIQLRANNKKYHFLAHRASYSIFHNIVLTSNQLILHSCDNPACINPLHLRIGTHNDNVADKVKRNRQAKGRDNGKYTTGYFSKYENIEKPKLNFTELHNRKLTIDTIKSIKEEIKNKKTNKLSLKQIAEKYDISYYTIRDISSNRVYKEII